MCTHTYNAHCTVAQTYVIITERNVLELCEMFSCSTFVATGNMSALSIYEMFGECIMKCSLSAL